MAIEQKIVCICDVCGYMVEANGCATAPDNWGHGKLGRIDLCPRCVKRVEHINDKIEREQRKRRVDTDGDDIVKSTRFSSGRYPWGDDNVNKRKG